MALSDAGVSRTALIAARAILGLGVFMVALGVALLILFQFNGPGWQVALVGVILLVIYGFFEPDVVRGVFGQGKVQAGTLAFLQVVFILAGVFLVNVLVRDKLADKTLDVSKNRVNSLAPQTQTVLQHLDKPVTAWVWYNQSASEMDAPYRLLKRYHDVSDKLTVQRWSQFEKPTQFLAQHAQVDSVVLQTPGRADQVVTDTSEQGLTSALISLTAGKSLKVYFLTGHGEGSITAGSATNLTYASQLRSLLASQGFSVQELNLSAGPTPTESPSPAAAASPGASPAPAPSPSEGAAQPTAVPADASALAILNPNNPLLPSEISAIQAYIDGGGRVLISDAPFSGSNVGDVSKKYGLTFGGGIVFDPKLQFRQSNLAYALEIQSFGQSVITRGLADHPAVLLGMTPVEGTAPQGYTLTPLVTTQDDSCERNDKKNTDPNCGAADKKGPFSLVASLEQTNAKTGSKPARLVLIGNSSFASDQFLSQLNAPGNTLLVGNAINWLAGQEKVINIPAKTTTQPSIFLSDAQAALLFPGYFLFVPFLIGVLGVSVWLRNRN